MKVLITGGAGYIGREIVHQLIDIPEVTEVIVYDNLSRGSYGLFVGGTLENGNKITFVKGDILDSRKLRKVMEGVQIVYHCAAKVSTPFADSEAHSYEQINHWGTAEVVYAAEELGVERFVYASSTSVYGASHDVFTELSVPNPKTFYGASKYRGEEHVLRLFPKMKAYILRCGNVYGYSRTMRFEAVINRFMMDAHFSKKISIHGDGKQSRGFVHVVKLAKLFAQILKTDVPSGHYNIVEHNFQVLDIVDVLKNIYPTLEFIFINQHLSVRELKVSPESELRKYIDFGEVSNLKDDLIAFRTRFSF